MYFRRLEGRTQTHKLITVYKYRERKGRVFFININPNIGRHTIIVTVISKIGAMLISTKSSTLQIQHTVD